MATLPLTTDTLEDVPSVETIDPDARRRELASFLRSRRERVQPQDVGLPPGIRRRTPGLRREEVAQLSGVGVTWYTWLEQGRDINVSTQVVDAIARTLKLDRYEWAHLSTLAGIATGPQPQQCAALPTAVRKVMHQVAPYPAAVLNDRFDLLAYNPEYRELIVDLDSLPGDRAQPALARLHQPGLAGGRDRRRTVPMSVGRHVPVQHGQAPRRARLAGPADPAVCGVAGVRRAVGAA